jgi:hypothetical protein
MSFIALSDKAQCQFTVELWYDKNSFEKTFEVMNRTSFPSESHSMRPEEIHLLSLGAVNHSIIEKVLPGLKELDTYLKQRHGTLAKFITAQNKKEDLLFEIRFIEEATTGDTQG